MMEREKVIKGLEFCSDKTKECFSCPYYETPYCGAKLAKDSLELLKEKEPKTGRWIEKRDVFDEIYYDCSACGESWTMIDGTPFDNNMRYCQKCGAKMKA